MNGPFKNSDFKVGAGLSLRWIMCDELNVMYNVTKADTTQLLSWINKGEIVKPEWLRKSAAEWLKLIYVLEFLTSIKVLDKDVFKTVTKDINDYLKLLNERL